MGQPKRFLVVGEGIWPWYMTAASDALRQLGYDVHEFHWADAFKEFSPHEVEPHHRSQRHRVEERLGYGPIVNRLNRDLVSKTKSLLPDYVLFYNVRLVHARTVKTLRTLVPRAIFGQYANDNPFSDRASFGYWQHFKRSVPLFDLHFAYRLENREDYSRRGARNIHLVRSYYLPDIDRPIPSHEIPDSERSDVLFAGHFEPDGRLEALASLADTGVKLRLHGGGWTPVLENLPSGHPLRSQLPASPVVGHDYRMAISGTSIALCFLSTMNKDTYTRRNFEIPAIGTAVLSEYSDDLAGLFREGEEIELFRSTEELLTKAQRLLADPELCSRIASAGHQRVVSDGHDVVSRMRVVSGAFEDAGRGLTKSPPH